MALWFVSYATSPITVTIYYVSIVIVYGVTLLLSMMYHFQSRLGKTDCTDIWVIKLKNQVSPSIGFRVPHYNRSAPCVYNVIVWGDMSHAHRVALKSSCTKKAVIRARKSRDYLAWRCEIHAIIGSLGTVRAQPRFRSHVKSMGDFRLLQINVM